MTNSVKKLAFVQWILLVSLLSPFGRVLYGQDHSSQPSHDVAQGQPAHGITEHKKEGEAKKKFNPGELILHHVADAHDWHFATIAGTHLTWYLPVIIYRGGEGVKVFSSRKLHHGHEEETLSGGEHEEPVLYEGYGLDAHEHLFRADGAKDFIDFSITKNVASLFISALLLFVVFLSVSAAYKKRAGGGVPKGLASLLEPIIVFVRDDIARPNIGPRAERYVPYLLTIFFFIWFNNLLGLMPGGANLTGNIAVTMVLALLTFLITTFTANKAYWTHIFNTPGVPWWLKYPIPLMPLVEFIGIFTKPFSLMIRLFANITAGHIIILSLLSLIFIFESYSIGVVSSAFVVVMMFMELLVAIIQAYVFTLLTAIYFGGAVAEHEHDHAHDEHHTQEFEHEYGQTELAKASL
jgi:F-type H+-transporting ATPase subunit a